MSIVESKIRVKVMVRMSARVGLENIAQQIQIQDILCKRVGMDGWMDGWMSGWVGGWVGG